MAADKKLAYLFRLLVFFFLLPLLFAVSSFQRYAHIQQLDEGEQLDRAGDGCCCWRLACSAAGGMHACFAARKLAAVAAAAAAAAAQLLTETVSK